MIEFHFFACICPDLLRLFVEEAIDPGLILGLYSPNCGPEDVNRCFHQKKIFLIHDGHTLRIVEELSKFLYLRASQSLYHVGICHQADTLTDTKLKKNESRSPVYVKASQCR